MYLLDTHAIIWYVIGSTELSATVRNIESLKQPIDILNINEYI